MKKKRYLLYLLSISLLLGVTWKMKIKKEVIASLYPRVPETFVGDPMPYYNGKDFLIYYLEDHREDTIGFHPFSLLKTRDFYQYENLGEVIPYVNEAESIERALGTGSVIQDKEGLYHAFYTGHNGTLTPKEQILHATSQNGKDWKKIPEDTFQASEPYDANDFRDPYVFWEEESQKYWMLITTRANQTGVIALYCSTDLKKWVDGGIFFTNDLGNDSNLECPSLVEYKGKWYLTFSDQGDKRVVHYRVADGVTDEFKSLEEIDHFDGAGFYAGRLETDGERLYLVGWIPTKERHEDRGNYNWAGNLAVHQLEATQGGRLTVKLPQSVSPSIETKLVDLSKEQVIENEEQVVIYETTYSPIGKEKIVLSIGSENHLVLDFAVKKMGYYYSAIEKLAMAPSITEIVFDEEDTYSLKIIKEKDIYVVYLGNKVLSNRIYSGRTADMKISIIE